MGHSTDKTSSSFSSIEKVVHYTVGGKEVVVDRAAGKDEKGKGKSQRPWKRGSRHDICDARLLPTPPAPPQLPRLLSSSVYRDKYVKNILWNKNIQTKLEFKNLMKTKFGDGHALSVLMLSYWYVAGGGKTRCRNTKATQTSSAQSKFLLAL